MSKRFIFVLLCVIICFSFVACGDKKVNDDGNVYARIELEDGRSITLELYPDVAPITVENFVDLANDGYYDGLIFHRVISGFMIQGGDPKGNGTGGPGYTIKGEFAANGVENNIKHTRGVISMARRGDSYDSAGSQFFIMHADAAHLDGQYAAFGKVLEGMDVVDSIASVPTGAANKPITDVVIKTIKILDEYKFDESKNSGVSSADVNSDTNDSSSAPAVEPDYEDLELADTVYAKIEMEDGGEIVLELYHSIAPITVKNFVSLANKGYYDGLIFHRVISGFMIQGGDPNGNGSGGPGYTIKGEFFANGVANNISHVRGVISMARRGDSYDSAGSQFFIMHADASYLDGQYAAFGRVLEGMDVVDSIASVSTNNSDKPLNDVVIKAITILDSYDAE